MAYTGRNQTMVMVDCTSRILLEAKVNTGTPYYKGEVLALCLENPFVDLIVGNIPGARERTDPDISWVPILAVQTRAQSRQSDQSETLKTHTQKKSSVKILPRLRYVVHRRKTLVLRKLRQCETRMKLEVKLQSLRRMICYNGSSVHPMLSVVGYLYS